MALDLVMDTSSETVKIIPCGVCRGMQVRGSDGLMIGSGMMFGKIIGMIGLSFAPIDCELALSNAIANPVEALVNCF